MYRTILERPDGLSDGAWQRLAKSILGRLQDATPVRTGHLRDSWDTSIDDDSVQAINTADYAKYVFEGTRNMSATDVAAEVKAGL